MPGHGRLPLRGRRHRGAGRRKGVRSGPGFPFQASPFNPPSYTARPSLGQVEQVPVSQNGDTYRKSVSTHTGNSGAVNGVGCLRAESASATRSPSLLLLAGLTGGFPGPVLGVFKMQVVRVPFAASDAVRWCVRPASPRSTRCAAFSTIGTRTVLCWKPSLEKAGWWRYSYRRRKKLLLHHFQPPHWHGMCQEHICLSAFLAAPTFLQGHLRRFSIRGPPPGAFSAR